MSSSFIAFDLEVKVSRVDGEIDNSPKNPDNYAVSAHFLECIDGILGPVTHTVWNHNDVEPSNDRQTFQDALNRHTIGVCHNSKFDGSWCSDMGFDLPKLKCTMVREYMFAMGRPWLVNLKDTAERRDVTRKKSDLVDEMFKNGIGFEAMPIDTVLEYAEADVISCAEIYLDQERELNLPENRYMRPAFDLVDDFTATLTHIEDNGTCIDLDVLAEVEEQFRAEHAACEKKCMEIASQVMGDTVVNLNSGPDMNALVYGRKVTDKELHKLIFNIGMGENGKPLPPARIKKSKFPAAVRSSTEMVYRTVVECCPSCDGGGFQRKFKKDGTPFKKQPKCKLCNGEGVIYIPTKTVAGLKLVPEDSRDASIHGFKVDKLTLKKLIVQAEAKNNLIAVEFLKNLTRLNAISVYLSSFVQGIQRWTRSTGLLHPNFNQTRARTGRLSSSRPNMQNMPKSNKFPVRKAMVSRFEGGMVAECDYSSLEFVVAGELSKDSQIISDIINGRDVHKQTASIINQCDESEVSKDMRQNAKAFTFAPLYGGKGANEAEHVKKYFKAYFTIYKGLREWHKQLMNGVIKDGKVRIPSGKTYMFENAVRLPNGSCTNATAVVNYPVQGFATGIIVPLACVRAHRRFMELGLRSKIILTVHDSLVIDVHPDELMQVRDALIWSMRDIKEEIKERFDYDFILPLNIEIEYGKNWMEMQELPLT